MRWIAAILALYLTSCANGDSEIGKYIYFYIEADRNMGCVVVHTDNNCGKSSKTLHYAGELYQTANYHNGQWTFRYRGNFDTPLSFCAKCVSEREMDMIADSIHARKNSLEEVQTLIDELQELKKQLLKQEAEMKQLSTCCGFPHSGEVEPLKRPNY